jgi:hypothetical protein
MWLKEGKQRKEGRGRGRPKGRGTGGREERIEKELRKFDAFSLQRSQLTGAKQE